MGSFSKKATSGILWMFSSSMGQNGLMLIVTIALARILLPADFGAIALVLAVVAILRTFAEMGTSVALVQRENINSTVIDSAFASTLVFTFFIVFLLYISSENIANFFKMPVLSGMFKIIALSYLFTGLFSLYRSLLLREMRYREISILEFLSIAIYGVVAIILAFYKLGPFSVVWGKVCSALFLLITGIIKIKYIPKSFGKFREAYQLLRFGIWVSIGRVLGSASAKFDTFIIGRLLDSATLGIYNISQKIVTLLPASFNGVANQVTFPIYSKWQKDQVRVEEGYWKALSYSALILMPPVFLVFVFADFFIPLILGDKWLLAISLVKIMSIYALTHALGGGIFTSVIHALNRPKINTIVNVFRIICLPLCIIIGGKWGIVGIAWGFSIYGVLGRFFNQWLLKLYFNFSFKRYFYEIAHAFTFALFATIIVTISTLVLNADNGPLQFLFFFINFTIWCMAYYWLVRLFLPKKLEYIKQVLFSRKRSKQTDSQLFV
jgi:O-antigen/teichoic acid export membrane protein